MLLIGSFLYWMIIGAAVAFVFLVGQTLLNDYFGISNDGNIKTVETIETVNADGSKTITTTTVETSINGTTSSTVEEIVE